MKYRALDESGDYTFGQNKFFKGREAVGQAILTRLKLLYGEWWEKTDDGLPLFENVFGVFASGERKDAVDLIISERITGTPGVEKIVSFESEFHKRVYSANCTINTIYGTVEVEVEDGAKKVEVKY